MSRRDRLALAQAENLDHPEVRTVGPYPEQTVISQAVNVTVLMGLEVPRQAPFAPVSWEPMDWAKRTGISFQPKDRADIPLPVVWVGDDYCSVGRTDQVAPLTRFIPEMMHHGKLIAFRI